MTQDFALNVDGFSIIGVWNVENLLVGICVEVVENRRAQTIKALGGKE